MPLEGQHRLAHLPHGGGANAHRLHGTEAAANPELHPLRRDFGDGFHRRRRYRQMPGDGVQDRGGDADAFSSLGRQGHADEHVTLQHL